MQFTPRMLPRLSLIWRSARIVGATLSVVWAKSQKVTTARTMPTIAELLVPRDGASAVAVITSPDTLMRRSPGSGCPWIASAR